MAAGAVSGIGIGGWGELLAGLVPLLLILILGLGLMLRRQRRRLAALASKLAEKELEILALQRESRLLEAVLEQAPFPILVGEGSSRNWRITRVNYDSERVTGAPALSQCQLGFLEGRLVNGQYLTWKTFYPDGSPMPLAEMPLVLAMQGRETRSLEMAIQRPDGALFHVLCHGAPIRDDDGTVIAGVVIYPDITDQKRMARALEGSRAELAEAQRIAGLGSWLLDIETGQMHCSAHMCRLVGAKPGGDGTVLLDTFLQRLHAEDRPPFAAALLQIQADGTPFDLTSRLTLDKGVIRWVQMRGEPNWDSLGRVVRVAGTCLDISQRRQAEQERDRFFSLSLDLFCIAGRDGTFRRLNAAWQQVLGWRETDLAGRPITDFLHPDDIEPTRKAIQTQKEGKHLIRFENRYRARDGSWHWLEWSSLSDGEGTLFAVARDITERKAQEAMLVQALEDLTHTNAELERFAYVASHDLQEPVRTVVSFAELLERRYGMVLDQNGREYLRFMTDGAKRMRALVRDLLTYSRLSNVGIAFSEVDLMEVLAGVQEELKGPITESGAEIAASALPTLRGDRAQLAELFLHLISNGLKFARDGLAPRLRIGASRTREGGWHLTFADNGIGIDPAYHEQIFEVFRRLHGGERYGGTGMGLAICQRVVRRHGGRIWVESTPGEGAVFHVTLPDTVQRSTSPDGKGMTNQPDGKEARDVEGR